MGCIALHYVRPRTPFLKSRLKVLLWHSCTQKTKTFSTFFTGFHGQPSRQVFGFKGGNVFILPFYGLQSYIIFLKMTFIYRTCAIISRGLYNFYPIFYYGLYSKAANITDQLCTKKWLFFKNILRFIIKSGFKSRAGYNGARTVYRILSFKFTHKIIK